MKGFRKTMLLTLGLVLLPVSCTKESRELMYAKQETNIESFVTKQQKSNPDARVVHNGGTTRVVVIEGTGVEATARGKVSIYYAGFNFTDGSVNQSSLFVTNNPSYAASMGWDLTANGEQEEGPLELDLTDRGLLDGLRRGLEGVKEGEECYILFSGKYAFGKSRIGTIPANSPLAFRVWVQNVEN